MLLIGLLFIAGFVTVDAAEPVVCLSGSGNAAGSNLDLSGCVPAAGPVYVELTASPRAQIYLVEGVQSCAVSLTNQPYPCAVTVADGVLDGYQVAGSPENYRLMAWSVTTTTATSIYTSSVYTYTLTSGDEATIERSFTYGERSITGLLFFISLMLVLIVVVFAISLLQVRR